MSVCPGDGTYGNIAYLDCQPKTIRVTSNTDIPFTIVSYDQYNNLVKNYAEVFVVTIAPAGNSTDPTSSDAGYYQTNLRFPSAGTYTVLLFIGVLFVCFVCLHGSS
jgi:hypothetical protein